MKKYIAEFFGAGMLTLIVGLSLKFTFPLSTPALAALVLGLFVYTIGSISGSHINPAVTIGLWSIGKIKVNDAFAYILSQCLGAVIALYIISLFPTIGGPIATDSLTDFLAEFFGTLVFTFGIASVVYGKVSDAISGLVIGGSLLLGIALAALIGSNGVLNPAVAFGIGSLSLVYIIGPILGSVAGMNLYKYLKA